MRRQEPEKISSRAPKVAQQKPAAVDDALREQKDNAKAVPHEEQQDIVAEALSDNEVKCRVMSSSMHAQRCLEVRSVCIGVSSGPAPGRAPLHREPSCCCRLAPGGHAGSVAV